MQLVEHSNDLLYESVLCLLEKIFISLMYRIQSQLHMSRVIIITITICDKIIIRFPILLHSQFYIAHCILLDKVMVHSWVLHCT